MASGTAIRPKSGTDKLTGTAGLGGTPYRHDQIAAEDAGHHGPLHALHLEAKFRKLGQHVLPLDQAVGQKIDQVYIGNCSNGTMTDLRQAADILRGRTVRAGCRMIVVPASQRVYRQALAEGLLDVFVAAGAMVSTPTCGACFGGGTGVLAAGERALTTTNRNFRGRMGSNQAEVCLANAWVAAAAAVAGEIVDPAQMLEGVPA